MNNHNSNQETKMKQPGNPYPHFTYALLPLLLASGFAGASETTMLDTVNVKGKRLSSRVEVRKHDIDRSTAIDLRDTLKDETGMQFGGGNGGTSQWMTIRGMGQDQIDIVVDGASSDSQIFHHQSRTTLDPALIRIIAVEKGTGTASAGIGAVAGRVKSETLDAADLLEEGRRFGVRINGNLHSNKGHVRGLTVYGRSESGVFDGLLTGNQTRLNNYKDGSGKRIEGSRVNQNGYLAKLGFQPHDDHRVEISHLREELNGNRSFRNEFAVQPLMDTKHRTDRTNLEYKGKNIGFADTAEFNLYHTKSQDHKKPLTPPANPAKPNVRNGEVEMYGENTATGANLGLSSTVNKLLQLKYGLNWRHSRAESRTVQNQKKTDYGVYLEGIWDFDPVNVITGVRYDRYSYHSSGGDKKTEGRINPGVDVVWDVTPEFSLNAAYRTATRSPRLAEAMVGSGNRRISSNLKAEQTRHAEAGFKYNNGALAISGSYFQQKIHNFNRYQDNGVTLTSQGTLKNNGYELSSEYQWRSLKARAGMSYNTPKLDGRYYDSIVSAVPLGRQWTTGLSYQFNKPKIEIGWRGRYAQRRSYTNTAGSEVIRKGFGVHDIYANWQPLGKETFNVNFAVNNVADKYYFSHSQRASNRSLPEAGRDIRLSMNYRF